MMKRKLLLLVAVSLLATLSLTASAYAGQIDPVLSSHAARIMK